MASGKDFLKGATIGAILASVATLMMAPQSGKKTRKDVQKLVDTLMKRIEKEAKGVKALTQENYEEIVNRSLKDYAKGKKIATAYMDEVSGMLKGRWSEVKKELAKK